MSGLRSRCRSIWRFHRLLAGILILEYALTFAMITTAFGLLVSRAEAIDTQSGVNPDGLYVLEGRGISEPMHRFQMLDATKRFAAVAGDQQVALGSSVPFFGRNRHVSPIRNPGAAFNVHAVSVNAYLGDERFAPVLGVRLLRGRWFLPDEVARRFGGSTHVVILSKTLAQRLFHGNGAVGKQVEMTGEMHTVVGIINPLAAPEYLGAPQTTDTVVLPKFPSSGNVLAIRYDGPTTDLQQALATLRKKYAGQFHWRLTPYRAIRAAYFKLDRLAVAALATVIVLVLTTALCGTLGLTNYWIAKRRPQIALRRALGGKTRNIQTHFLAETALLVLVGLLVGAAITLLADAYLLPGSVQAGDLRWALSTALMSLLAMTVVYVSLSRWLRMAPADLMRKG